MDVKSESNIEKQEIDLPERVVDPETPTTPVSNTVAQTPPERLSEKRRREDEDDDELVRLSYNGPKRRSSSSASSTASMYFRSRRKGPVEQTLAAKKAAGHDASGGTAPKKIAINLGPALKSSMSVEAEAIQLSDPEETSEGKTNDGSANGDTGG
jgi:protein phosphatase-4 regulatory subunit 3